jgi:hypothetical protein
MRISFIYRFDCLDEERHRKSEEFHTPASNKIDLPYGLTHRYEQGPASDQDVELNECGTSQSIPFGRIFQ